MLKYIACAALLFSGKAQAALSSPFPSSVSGISIPNTHLIVKKNGTVLRGMAPLSRRDVEDLVRAKVTDVLIFRNDVAGESGIAQEEALLKDNAAIKAIHKIPFKWKDVGNFETPCRQTIQALKIVKKAMETNEAGLFFHCTVGEDRTGLLAGVYRLLFEKQTAEDVFKNEMCARGYAEGDPGKPTHVVELVHRNLTPVYLKMAAMIEAGELRPDNLNEDLCSRDPSENKDFRESLKLKLKTYRCKKT